MNGNIRPKNIFFERDTGSHNPEDKLKYHYREQANAERVSQLVERPVEHRKEIARAAAQTAGPPDRRRRAGSEIEDSRQRNDREQQNARQQNNSVDLPIIHLVHKTSKGGRPTGQPPFVSHRRPN